MIEIKTQTSQLHITCGISELGRDHATRVAVASCRSNWACSNSFWVETFLGKPWFCLYMDWSFKWSSEKGRTPVVFGACANSPGEWLMVGLDIWSTYIHLLCSNKCLESLLTFSDSLGSTAQHYSQEGSLDLGFLDGQNSGSNISSGSLYYTSSNTNTSNAYQESQVHKMKLLYLLDPISELHQVFSRKIDFPKISQEPIWLCSTC